MTRPIRLEQPLQGRPGTGGLLSTVALRTDQRSWDGDLVPAGASGTIVEILKNGEAYVVDVAEPFDAIVTVEAPELADVDDRRRLLEANHPLCVRIVPFEKISEYLLSSRTAKSHSRCLFFTAYGFHPNEPQRLVDAIYRHPETGLISPLPTDAYGQRWNVVGPIRTPDGRNPVIRTG